MDRFILGWTAAAAAVVAGVPVPHAEAGAERACRAGKGSDGLVMIAGPRGSRIVSAPVHERIAT